MTDKAAPQAPAGSGELWGRVTDLCNDALRKRGQGVLVVGLGDAVLAEISRTHAVVPLEATEEMIAAGDDAAVVLTRETLPVVYRAMIAAAEGKTDA